MKTDFAKVVPPMFSHLSVRHPPVHFALCLLAALVLGLPAAAAPTEVGPEVERVEELPSPAEDETPAAGAAKSQGEEAAEAPVEAEPEEPQWGMLEILGEEVPPGSVRELSLSVSETYIGLTVDVPVVVVRGVEEGPTLCLTAGIHGDELNGIEVVRNTMDRLRPTDLVGTVIGIPIVNVHGFQTSSRYLPDRRDLNRFFPGNATGSSASRIARRIFREVIQKCSALIDLHTGGSHRSNLPQVRGDLRDERILELARSFRAGAIVHNPGPEGTLRRAAHAIGIPAIVYEAGEPMRFQAQEIKRGVIGVRNVLMDMKMIRGTPVSVGEQRIFFRTEWVRADRGGILVSEVRLGDHVREGEILGTITDPIRKETHVILSPHRGQILGMAVAPVMIPGYAAFHIGIPGAAPEDFDDLTNELEHPE